MLNSSNALSQTFALFKAKLIMLPDITSKLQAYFERLVYEFYVRFLNHEFNLRLFNITNWVKCNECMNRKIIKFMRRVHGEMLNTKLEQWGTERCGILHAYAYIQMD